MRKTIKHKKKTIKRSRKQSRKRIMQSRKQSKKAGGDYTIANTADRTSQINASAVVAGPMGVMSSEEYARHLEYMDQQGPE